jgi:hypothetical protein
MRQNLPSRRRSGSRRNGSPRAWPAVGPNARLMTEDLAGAIRAWKAARVGEIEVAGRRSA